MIDTKTLDIGPTEYRLLLFLLQHRNRVFSRSQLLDQVWGGDVYIEERTVDVHIRRLRKRLQRTAEELQDSDGVAYEQLIETIRGAGYLLNAKHASLGIS